MVFLSLLGFAPHGNRFFCRAPHARFLSVGLGLHAPSKPRPVPPITAPPSPFTILAVASLKLRLAEVNMRVLVVHASRYGATQGIAERIAAQLRQQGFSVTMQPAPQADDPSAYDAVVIGSATYFGHWMKPATEYVKR